MTDPIHRALAMAGTLPNQPTFPFRSEVEESASSLLAENDRVPHPSQFHRQGLEYTEYTKPNPPTSAVNPA